MIVITCFKITNFFSFEFTMDLLKFFALTQSLVLIEVNRILKEYPQIKGQFVKAGLIHSPLHSSFYFFKVSKNTILINIK